jgi:hypothetical protein
MEKKLDTKVTGLGPMARNRKRGQGSSWTAVPIEKRETKELHYDENLCYLQYKALNV